MPPEFPPEPEAPPEPDLPPVPTARPSLSEPPILLATWFGSGYLPRLPGTWGSLAALPVAWPIHHYWGSIGLAAAALVVFAAGIWAANVYMLRSDGAHDPGPIVVDEVAGQWLTLLAAGGPDLLLYAAGFMLFRIFDILKPWPCSLVDRKVVGGFGVMLDDVLAAVYAGAALYGVRELAIWGMQT